MSSRLNRRNPSVLVVGAGLAGMTSAAYLAEWGAHVYLADCAPHLGGTFLLLDRTLPQIPAASVSPSPASPATAPRWQASWTRT